MLFVSHKIHQIITFGVIIPYYQILTNTEETPDNLTHKKTFSYDGYGRVLTENTYSYLTADSTINNGNNTIEYGYNSYNGMIEQYKDAGTQSVLWKLNTANEKMQALTVSFGNGMNITNKYDNYGYFETAKHISSTSTALNLEYQFNTTRGILNYRKNNIAGVLSWNETFTYDTNDRLTSWTDPTGTTTTSYETDGRIKNNDQVGTYDYESGNRYRKKSATLNSTGIAFYTNRSPQTVSYDMFKNPINITEANRGKVDFEYNLDNTRSKSVVAKEAGTVAKTKYYSGISAVEVIEKPNQSLQFITYIAGSPYDASVALEKTYTKTGGNYAPATQEYLYLHRDYQGTILAISGNGGVIKERRQFDAWGLIKKQYKNEVEVNPATFNNVDFELLTDRGYTGHEHFFSVGIIHMNARLYDPILHTFLSPDALISDPNNPQNYNRYAYALNNPLMYVDYDGNEAITAATLVTAAIIGAVVAGVSYVGISLYNGTAITWGGLTKSILVGAISGMASAGIGSIIGSANTAICAATQTLTQTQITLMLSIPQALMHGIAQGIIQGVSGGDAGQSFITAAISSIASGGFAMTGSFGSSIVGTSLFGTVAGGVTSRLQGGNFWEGAAIGLTVSLLNHAGEKLNQAIQKAITINRINHDLKAMGLEPTDEAEINSNEQLRDFIKKMFEKSLKKTGEAFGIYLEEIIIYKGQSCHGLTTPTEDGNGVIKIQISKSALSSWRQLASTVGHELNHAYHFISGAYNRWSRIYGRDYAMARTEVLAYDWEYNNGGIYDAQTREENYLLMISSQYTVGK